MKPQVIQAAERAMRSAAVAVHEDFKHGLNTLATITSVAPFVGIFGTVRAISCDTFTGLGTEKYTAMAALCEALARACVPSALGLLVGLQSLWCYRYFQHRLAAFDHEMKTASLALLNQSRLELGRFNAAIPIASVKPSLPFLETYSLAANETRRCWRRSALPAIALLTVSWCVEVVRYFDIESLPFDTAVHSACQSVLITFCCSCLPTYAIWVDLLHRKSAGVMLLAAALCLSWCVQHLWPLAIPGFLKLISSVVS